MSLEAYIWSWKFDLKPKEKLVLLGLADHADPQGKAFPSTSFLAKKTGLSQRSVFRSLKILEGEEIIVIDQRKDKNNRDVANNYTLNMGKFVEALHKISPFGYDTQSPPVCQAVTPGMTVCHTSKENLSLNLPKDMSSSKLDLSYEVQIIFKFWQMELSHPRAKLDQKRRAKIKQALKDYSVEDCKKAIVGNKVSAWHKENKQHDIELILRDSAHIERFMGFAADKKQEQVKKVPKLCGHPDCIAQSKHVGQLGQPLCFQHYEMLRPKSEIELEMERRTKNEGTMQ